jgi:iron complex outermembrane receptor protein
VRVTNALSFRAGAGVLSTKILEGTVSGANVAGNRLANAPAFTFNAGADFTVMDSGSGKLSFHPDLSYQSSQYFEVLNIPRLRQSSYALLGGHIDYETAGGRFSASLWAKNIAQTFYFTSRVDLLAGFGLDYNHIGNPRTYGATIGYKF